MDQSLCILAASGIANAAYELGLKYCFRNEKESALFWLKRAAHKGHAKAIMTIHEMLDRRLL